jgi:hypothetical protein
MIAALVLAALTVAAATACGGSDGEVSGETGASTTEEALPGTTVAEETGERPSGGPAPAELQGTWLTKYLGGPARLYIREDGYAVSAGDSAQGDIVVDGRVIAFFNSNSASCPPEPLNDIGRYQWTISDQKLRLKLLGKDPCGGRVSVLTNGPSNESGSSHYRSIISTL